MEKLIEDALTVQKYLPWLENDEEIINFMRRIPLDNSYLRIPITIKYFLNLKDKDSVFEGEIEDDAKEIVTILPNIPYKEVKNCLKELGSISNRKEVVLRKLLNTREDLELILQKINNESDNRKRSPNLKIDEVNSHNSKIRKVTKPRNGIPDISNSESDMLVLQKVNKKSKKIVEKLNSKRIIQPARFLLPEAANTNEAQLQQGVPAIAGQIPVMKKQVPAIVEQVPVMAEQVPVITEQIPVIAEQIPVIAEQVPLLGKQSSASLVREIFSKYSKPIPKFYEVQLPNSKIPLPIPNSHISVVSREIPALPQHFVNKFPDITNDYKHSEFSAENIAKAGPSKEILNQVHINLIEDDPTELLLVKKERNCDEQLVLRLIEMFPDTCPEYIRDICDNKIWLDFDEIVTIILENENHPKRQRSASPPKDVDPEEQLEIIKALLPDADPTYLRMHCDNLEYNPEELNKFVIQAREKKDYPTIKDHLRKQQLSAQSKQYTTEFSIEKFVELFPEPHITFNDPKRHIEMDNYSKLYVKQYFENKFDQLPKRAISSILTENKFQIIATSNKLMQLKNSSLKMKSRRKNMPFYNDLNNILVLQEIAYIEHKDDIEKFLKAKEEKEKEDQQYAKDNGLMNTCQCCFDDAVMPKDTFYCPKDCLFCRSCIKKSCEITFGEGRTNFKCLNDCLEEFSLQTLQAILMPKMFSKLAQKKMIEEIKAAGIEDLEMCPFCDFATIPNEHDKIFKCLNPDCMKESCRNCKEPNHIPLHCDEIEKDENVKARVFIENKMTEALLCTCWKCGTSFFKEEGCNKMTCTCGAQMCYICKKPVSDYSHFNGMGGDKYHLCPLYSDNNNLNHQKVQEAVDSAKAQIDQSKLKVDPTNNLHEYFENQSKRRPQEPYLNLLLDLELRRNILLGRGRNRNPH